MLERSCQTFVFDKHVNCAFISASVSQSARQDVIGCSDEVSSGSALCSPDLKGCVGQSATTFADWSHDECLFSLISRSG